MDNKLNLALLMISMATSLAIVAAACLTNYDYMLANGNASFVLLLFFMNVSANTFQITLSVIPLVASFLKGARKKIPEDKLDLLFYKIQEDLRLSYNNLQSSEGRSLDACSQES